MSLKNPVTTPGIHPGTVRLVSAAQRLNHYATPSSSIGKGVLITLWIYGGETPRSNLDRYTGYPDGGFRGFIQCLDNCRDSTSVRSPYKILYSPLFVLKFDLLWSAS